MATRTRRRELRKAFVTTVAAAAVALLLPACDGSVDVEPGETSCPEARPAVGSACGGSMNCYYDDSSCGAPFTCVDGAWVDQSPPCNPPPPEECPDSAPADGSVCWNLDMVCDYPGWDECEPHLTATCVGGTWDTEEQVVSCNPPEPCPGEVPEDGSSCGAPMECDYTAESPCGPVPTHASCDGGTWSVDSIICNPPPPDPCTAIASLADCVADPTCRWLVPGCGQPMLPQEGCFPLADCSPESCPPGESCQVASTLCDNCQTCDFPVQVCLPAGPPEG